MARKAEKSNLRLNPLYEGESKLTCFLSSRNVFLIHQHKLRVYLLSSQTDLIFFQSPFFFHLRQNRNSNHELILIEHRKVVQLSQLHIYVCVKKGTQQRDSRGLGDSVARTNRRGNRDVWGLSFPLKYIARSKTRTTAESCFLRAPAEVWLVLGVERNKGAR